MPAEPQEMKIVIRMTCTFRRAPQPSVSPTAGGEHAPRLPACAQTLSDYTLLAETPAIHDSPSVARFIEQEVARPTKQWINHILDGTQEKDDVVCRTDDFVLLPDTERLNRYWRCPPLHLQQQTSSAQNHSLVSYARTASHYHQRVPRRVLNWLAILQDRRIRTLRDLRGHHVPMLKALLHLSLQSIESLTGIRQDQVMAYVHYPPSVYQLHVHFSYPYGQYCHRDAYRVHNLATIINNLEIEPEYYKRATLHMAVYKQSLHYTAISEARCDQEVSVKKEQDADPDKGDS